jgi:hypothetical protein
MTYRGDPDGPEGVLRGDELTTSRNRSTRREGSWKTFDDHLKLGA